MTTIFKSIILAGFMFFAACDDPKKTKLQYFPDMVDSPAFKAQGNYLDPPEGSISYKAVLYPDTAEEAEHLFKNPFKDSTGRERTRHLENGKRLYEIYCSVCHGDGGAGGMTGKISDVFVPSPNLMLDAYANRKDGFYFYRITHGSAIMPKYGDKTTIPERWEITMHLRELQKEAAANTTSSGKGG